MDAPHSTSASQEGSTVEQESSNAMHRTIATSSLRLWILEVFAIVVTIITFAALIIILWHFDGKPLLSWSLHGKSITLNTIISILSKAITISIMLAMSEGMGQWKWIIFTHERRRLLDFEELDSASHSELAILKLFLKPRKLFVFTTLQLPIFNLLL